MKKSLTPKQIHKVREIYEDRGCASCNSLYSAVSWWCGNEDAHQIRGTRRPGCIHCTCWSPDKKWIRDVIKKEK